MKRPLVALGAIGMLLAAAGCADDSSDPQTLNVSAAASLKSTFTELAEEFERQHPDVAVTVSFDGSSTLATQIEQGAPADVFASADEKNMAALGDLAVEPQIFATNTLVIVTAPGNPKGIGSFADLNKPGITTVVCQPAQPCGSATAMVEADTGVRVRAASEEQSVSAVLTKVTTGQADAGVVYVTDARAAGDAVATVNDPAFAAVINRYPIATLSESEAGEPAAEFVALVLGPEGRRILADAGFGLP